MNIYWVIYEGSGMNMAAIRHHFLWLAVVLACLTACAGPKSLSQISAMGDVVAVEAYLKNGVDINAPDERRSSTPLTAAAGTGNVEVVKLLLKHGADIDRKNPLGSTPLISAAYGSMLPGAIDVARELIKRGADVSAQDSQGMSALHIAVSHNGNLDLIDLLVDGRIPVDVRGGPSQMTPLHVAASRSSVENMGRLLRNGASIEARDDKGRTALYFAAQRSGAGKISYLIANGADVNTRANTGLTPLHLVGVAPLRADMDAAADLIRHGAKLDSEDDHGRTPLEFAVANGR